MIFDKFVKFISKISKNRPRKSYKFNNYSKFKQYLLELDKNDDAFSSVSYAADLCDEALEIVRKRLVIRRQINNLDERLANLECYHRLSDEDAEHLKDLLQRIISLSDERKQLIYQVTDFDSSLTYLIEYMDEVPNAIAQMTIAEQKQTLLRQDMGLIEGEKADLEHERENLELGADFLYKFSILGVVLISVTTFILAFLAIFRNISIFYPLSGTAFVAIILIVLVYMLNRKIKYELALNSKMMKRAVDLLNKKVVLYAHYTNFLRFTCKKYKVKNSIMLKNNLNDVSKYKHLAGRLDAITNIMYQTETQLDKFLRDKDIKNLSSTNLRLAKTLDIDDKKRYYRELTDEKAALSGNLADLDVKHEELWDQLVELNNNDRTKQNIIEQIIKTYFDEVGRLVELSETEASEDVEGSHDEEDGEEDGEENEEYEFEFEYKEGTDIE